MCAEEIGEEEDFQDDKDDKQFDGNDQPQRPSQRHITEAVIVQMKDTMKEMSHHTSICSKDTYYSVTHQIFYKKVAGKDVVLPFFQLVEF